MQIEKLSYEKTNIQRPLTNDYLNQKESLKNLYQFRPEIEAVKEAIEIRKNYRIDRDSLVKVFKEQYEKVFLDFKSKQEYKKVRHNIELLKEQETFTITTGHQLNIFGGPLYYFYKMASAIHLANQLKSHFREYNFVPIYWMATEDHDFEEINHIHLFGNTFKWETEARGPVGRLDPSSLKNLLNQIKQQIREEKKFDDHLGNLWNKAFDQPDLAKATIYWVTELFRDYGLLVLDPDHKDLKKMFIDVMKTDLKENIHHDIVDKSVEKLKSYNPPVNPRKINIFYIKDNLRERIEKEGKTYKVLNTDISFTDKELFEELEENPENFSPNVVLRPLYQEKILPNLAYIGGTNEIAYWLELKALFDHNKIFFPQLLVRNSALWIGGGIKKKMEKFNLINEDLFCHSDDIIRFYLKEKEDASPFDEKISQLQNLYEALMEECNNYHDELKWPIVNKSKDHIKDLEKLQKDIRKLLKKRNEKDVDQINKIYDMLFPEGIFQERYENFISYFLILDKAFIKILIDNFDPYNKELIIIKL